jgi:hypothetical protein
MNKDFYEDNDEVVEDNKEIVDDINAFDPTSIVVYSRDWTIETMIWFNLT